MEKWLQDTYFHILLERLPPDTAVPCLGQLPANENHFKAAYQAADFSIGYSLFTEKARWASGTRGIELNEIEIEKSIEDFFRDLQTYLPSRLHQEVRSHLPSDLRQKMAVSTEKKAA